MKKYRGVFFVAAAFIMLFLCVPKQIKADTLTKYGMLPIYGVDVNDGEYPVSVRSETSFLEIIDSKLFVKDGEMEAFISVKKEDGEKYPYLYLGDAQQAEEGKENENKTVTVKSRSTEDADSVYEIPVSALDKEITCSFFDLQKQQWKTNRVLFEASSLPKEALDVELPDYKKIEDALNLYDKEREERAEVEKEAEPMAVDMEDGEYSIAVDCVGGSGKASVVSPTLFVVKDGKAYARIQWSSPNYDYMIVGKKKYLNENKDGGNSVFTIPVSAMDKTLHHIADTTAMGEPHEIIYAFTFYRDSIGAKGEIPQEAARKVVAIALIIIVGGGILNHFVKRRFSTL